MQTKSKKGAFDPYDFSRVIYDGVPVYYKNFPTSPCIHIHICFNVGSLDDREKSAGISHFLEHMIFDGSPKIPDKKAVEEWRKLNTLGSWNAWTFFSNTNYHLRCLPEKFETVLDGMFDMIFNPFLRAKDVEHERKVITQEAWGVYKNEKYLRYCKETLHNSYHGTLREKTTSPLGWPETVAKITQEDITKWHKENYGKGNFFIVVAGKIKDGDLKKVENFIKNTPTVKTRKIDFGNIGKPKKLSLTKTGEEIGDPREQAEISFDRVQSVKSASGNEIQKMSEAFLYDILFERLRTEKALCYGVSVGAYGQKDFIMWNVNLKVKDDSVNVVKKEFWKALDDITSGKEKTRFNKLKQVRIDRLKSLEEITANTTEQVLNNLWRFGKTIPFKSMLKEREDISYKDVSTCLKNAFQKDWTVTEVILPSKK